MSFSAQADVIALECKANEPRTLYEPQAQAYEHLVLEIDREARVGSVRNYFVTSDDKIRGGRTNDTSVKVTANTYDLMYGGSSLLSIYSVNRQTLETTEIWKTVVGERERGTYKCSLAPQPENQI